MMGMRTIHIWRALAAIDAKSVGRDALLRWVGLFPVLLALAARQLIPALFARLGTLMQLDVTPFYPDLMSVVLLMLVPMLTGFMIGFLLLDQRDDQTLAALQVTPLSLNGYLWYRLLMPMGMSVVLGTAVLLIANLIPLAPYQMILAALLTAPLAPLFALFLAAFAANKVQGFALMKASGVVMIPPLLAYFLPAAWQRPFFIFPTYWPAKFLWSMQSGEMGWVYFIGGFAYQLLLLAWLVRRFNARQNGR